MTKFYVEELFTLVVGDEGGVRYESVGFGVFSFPRRLVVMFATESAAQRVCQELNLEQENVHENSDSARVERPRPKG